MAWDVLGHYDFGMGLNTNWEFPFGVLNRFPQEPYTLKVECVEGGKMVNGVWRYPNVLGIIGRFHDYTDDGDVPVFLDSKKIFYGNDKVQLLTFAPFGNTSDVNMYETLPGGALYEWDTPTNGYKVLNTVNPMLGFKASKIKKGTRPVTVNFPDDYTEVRQSWWFDKDTIGFLVKVSIWNEGSP